MHNSGDVCKKPLEVFIASIWISGARDRTRLGVSISRYPRLIKKHLKAWIIAARSHRLDSLSADLPSPVLSRLFFDPSDIFSGPGIDGYLNTFFNTSVR